MSTVIIDTDIALDYLRGREYAKDLLKSWWNNNIAYISILTAYELYAGIKEDEKEATENFIAACRIEPITLEIAERAGELFRRYRKRGLSPTAADCLINATAIINEHKIATRSISHYPDRDVLLNLPFSYSAGL